MNYISELDFLMKLLLDLHISSFVLTDPGKKIMNMTAIIFFSAFLKKTAIFSLARICSVFPLQNTLTKDRKI